MARREEITPELLRILEDTVNRAAELAEDSGYMAFLYAMYLLAQFREIRAYPLVVRFGSLPTELLDELSSDFITEGLGRVLASVCGGDLTGIKSLLENEATDKWVRVAAIGSLATLVVSGEKSQEEILSYFRSLFGGKLERKPSQVWDALLSNSSRLYAAELYDEIVRTFEEGLIDPAFIGLDDVRRHLSIGKERALAKLARDSHYLLIEDTVAEMEWWGCFDETEANGAVPATPKWKPNTPALSLSPITRASPKIGRNQPCPCGSSKKYKRCCGA